MKVSAFVLDSLRIPNIPTVFGGVLLLHLLFALYYIVQTQVAPLEIKRQNKKIMVQTVKLSGAKTSTIAMTTSEKPKIEAFSADTPLIDTPLIETVTKPDPVHIEKKETAPLPKTTPKTEVKKDFPKKVETKKAEPKKIETKKVSSKKVDSKKTEAPKIETPKTEVKKEIKAEATKETAKAQNPAKQQLLQKAKESLAQLDKEKNKNTSSPKTEAVIASTALTAIASYELKSLLASIDRSADERLSPQEVAFEDELAARLKLSLRLPEMGNVQLKLQLKRSGEILKVDIVKSSSEKNRQYVLINLPKIALPHFGNNFSGESEHTFSITLKA